MTKHVKYLLRLSGDPPLVAVLRRHVPESAPSLRTARDMRRAIEVLFGEAAKLEIVAVAQARANMRRL